MTVNDIVALAKAGFTAQQISAMTAPAQPQTPPAQQWTAPAQPQTPPAQQWTAPAQPQTPPAQQWASPAQQTAPTTAVDMSQQLMDMMRNLTYAVQANAINNTAITPNQRTTDDIIADIINPPLPAETNK